MTNPFNVLNENAVIEEITQLDGADTKQKIESLIKSAPIVLVMKGNAQMPMCGFSANSIGILTQLNKSFKTFNILEDMDIRQGIKEYSNWPTFPQLYINGQLVGGNDIITELAENGELQKMVAQI